MIFKDTLESHKRKCSNEFHIDSYFKKQNTILLHTLWYPKINRMKILLENFILHSEADKTIKFELIFGVNSCKKHVLPCF